MDSPGFPYATFPYAQPAMEDRVFQPHPYQGQFDLAVGSYIDPILQQSPPNDPYLSQWERQSPSVKRWMSDHQRTALFHANLYSNAMAPVAQSGVGTSLVHPPYQAPFATSPIPSSDRGLTASSPLAETDPFYDNKQPSTPSDAAVVSPSFHPGRPESYTSREEVIQFMGPASPAYVRPLDVDPTQQLGYHDAEADRQEFSLEDHRGYSFESGTSHSGTEPAQNEIAVALTRQRRYSPEQMQPFTPEGKVTSQDPPLPEHDGDNASVVPDERPLSKRKKQDDDQDYTPGKKAKTGVCKSFRKTRTKPMAPKPSSPKKKPTASSQASPGPRSLLCPHCERAPFKDEATLDRHIKQHTRPFKCVFHFAGCTSTFAAKNEWKRHNSTQHLVTRYWLCTEGPCSKTVTDCSPISSARPDTRAQAGGASSASNPPTSPISAQADNKFSRKDLFTQHVRRMHTPQDIKKNLKLLEAQRKARRDLSTKNRKAAPPSPLQMKALDWEEQVRQRQAAALRERDILPTYMRCPANGCDAEFRAQDAWDPWMEHVAKHLDSGDRGEVRFGGPEDRTLVEWAGSADVGVIVAEGKGWVLNKVMRKSGKKEKGERREAEAEAVEAVAGGDEDAEGEEDDDVF